MIRFKVKDVTYDTLPAAMSHIVAVEMRLAEQGFTAEQLSTYVATAFHSLHSSMTRAATDAAMDESGVLAAEFREAVTVRELAA